MKKQEQFIKSMKNKGIDLGNFEQGHTLSSAILARIRGGMNDPSSCHNKGSDHVNTHSKHPVHSKCRCPDTK